jgi:MinD-like ATPase involved in chromosome partitioning or flagellar assembly
MPRPAPQPTWQQPVPPPGPQPGTQPGPQTGHYPPNPAYPPNDGFPPQDQQPWQLQQPAPQFPPADQSTPYPDPSAYHQQTAYPPQPPPSQPFAQPQFSPPGDDDQGAGQGQFPAQDGYTRATWQNDGAAPTAEEFARRRMARPSEPVASQGPRAFVRAATAGLIKMGPGRREQEWKNDIEKVRRNFGGLRQVTVVNPKGGAGKTVAVLLLAMTFGQNRGGYVLAWDNNETQGTLGMRAQQDFHSRTVRDMMRDLHLFRGAQGRVGDLSQYVRAQGEGMFDVLASDESATAGEMLTASAFGEIREIVSRFYKLIFVDTGNNVRAHNWHAALEATDQLVVTMSARNDSAETAARMLDHLEQAGLQKKVRQAISVVTMPPTRKDIDLPAIKAHFGARTRQVITAPYEKLIDSGEPLRYGQLSSATKEAWLKIAAAVAEGL